MKDVKARFRIEGGKKGGEIGLGLGFFGFGLGLELGFRVKGLGSRVTSRVRV